MATKKTTNTKKKSGKNIGALYGARGRQDLLLFAPEDITIIRDRAHPLYDERAELPLSESLVLNIMAHGVIEPIVVRRNGETAAGIPIIECVAGRQRVAAAAEANRRFLAEGKQPIRVPAVTRRGDDATIFGIIISENEQRRGDLPLVRARKMQRYLDMGRSLDDAAVMYGVDKQTVRATLALLDLSPPVQQAVDRGDIGMTLAAQTFTKLPREEQEGTLTKLLASGAARGAAAAENVRRIRRGEEPRSAGCRLANRAILEGMYDKLVRSDRRDARAVCAGIALALRRDDALADYPALSALLDGDEG